MKDHLGNTRISFNVPGSTAVIVQQSDYYPYGMTHKPQAVTTSDNRYLFNGKELQNNLLGGVNLDRYDYGARFYDPQIGRWQVIDPNTEQYFGWSPYNYVTNNPLNLIDPDGRSGEVVIDKQNKTVTVTSNLILYGSAGSAALAKSTAGDIQKQWNAAGGTVSIGGAEYRVKFVVNGSYNANLRKVM